MLLFVCAIAYKESLCILWARNKSKQQEHEMYIVFNIGCIECGVSSAIVGIFKKKECAEKVAEAK